MVDSLAADTVVPLLSGRFGTPYVFVPRCPSTQRLLPADAPEGAVAVTDGQTEGRGRLGRRWLAPPGTSILCSIRLHPRVATHRLPELPLVAAAACAAAIGTTGVPPELKAPNDVLIRGRKVAGVLAEARSDGVTLGVGINVNIPPSELPRDVRLPATSLLAEPRRLTPRAELLAALLAELERRYDEWLAAHAAVDRTVNVAE